MEFCVAFEVMLLASRRFGAGPGLASTVAVLWALIALCTRAADAQYALQQDHHNKVSHAADREHARTRPGAVFTFKYRGWRFCVSLKPIHPTIRMAVTDSMAALRLLLSL